MTPEQITKLIELLLTVIALLISAYLIPYLKNKIGADKLQLLQKFVEAAVRAAEQMYETEEWKLNKDYVTRFITAKVEELGLELSEADIDAIIEGIVNYVKHNKTYEAQ